MPKLGDPGLRPYWRQGGIRLYHGDCLTILPQVGPCSVDLVFADPPFNIGYKYDEYDDNKVEQDYLKWTLEWLWLCNRILKPMGSIWVASNVKYQAQVRLLMDKANFHWRDTVVWHYTFGPRQTTKFTPSWVALHYATKSPDKWTWNPDEVKVPSARQLKYTDRRAKAGGKLPDNVWMLLPDEYKDTEVFDPNHNLWLESRVCGTFKERVNHPCQMPIPVLERIVKVSSNPGDLVCDPFVGSGTTLVAAQGLGRKGIGIELSKDYLDQCAIPRLSGAYNGKGGGRGRT